MPRKSFSIGPTGTTRISLDAQHLVRYWRAELGCSEGKLRDANPRAIGVTQRTSDILERPGALLTDSGRIRRVTE